jgi:choline kinase
MKAVILVAGFGTRLRPLTNTIPKCMLPIGDSTPLARTVGSFLTHGVTEFIFITGKFDEQIRRYVTDHFPDIQAHYIRKEHYPSNTGYSLMLASPYLGAEPFIKIDGDLIFEDAILGKLMKAPDDANFLCLDRTAVDDEVIKVTVNKKNIVTAIGKNIETKRALGESIGLEKICSQSSRVVLDTLKVHMKDKANWQEYYEFTYDYLVRNNLCTFKYIDITDLKWVEVDTPSDYQLAQNYFSEAK